MPGGDHIPTNMSIICENSSFPVPIRMPAEGFLSKGGIHYDTSASMNFLQSHKDFQRWMARTLEKFGTGFTEVRILSIYPFTHTILGDGTIEPGKNGFVWVDADITFNGKAIPGAALIRGDAVAMLPILRAAEESTEEFTITTVQPRAPIGESSEIEVPAGMLDGNKNFGGVAAKEMAEETGLTFSESEMRLIGEITPSGGGCDESIKLFRCVKVMPRAEILALQGKLTGNLVEGEAITLKLWNLSDFVLACLRNEIKDAKAKSLLFHNFIDRSPYCSRPFF